ncbi:MAG: phosphopantetheine-binding protein [Bacteroidia bacterium]|nr:phosphopantetheine-binding protein [Bacteroidia bacterium]
MSPYRQQAFTLAHELTNFVLDESTEHADLMVKWPESDEVGPVFRQLLEDLMVMDDHEWKDATKLRDDLGMDSLDMVELVMNCEREMGIVLQDAEWQGLSTIGEWIALLKGHVANRK